MDPADESTGKQDQNAVAVIGHGLWATRQGDWVDIHMTGPDDSHIVISNDPESVRYHRTLFVDLRHTLVHQQCWPFGEEGLECSSPDPVSRFNPVPIRGEPLSETIIRERGAR